MKIRLLSFIFLILCSFHAFAEEFIFDFNAASHKAYEHYLSLNLEEGNQLVSQELKNNSNNLIPVYLADYGDCLLLLMNGNDRDYAQRKSNLNERLKLIEKGDKNTPWYRLCKGGLYFHWALVYIRFGENLKAGLNFRKSFLLLKENEKLFPDFPQNKIFLGVQEAVVGTIPEDYRWLASIFGMKGSVKKGVQQLEHFLANSDSRTALRNEAVIYHCYLRFYLMSQQEAVWEFVNSSRFPAENNLMHSFVRANIALNFRKHPEAEQVLKQAMNMKAYRDFPILDYEMGSALLHQLDEKSVFYLERFLQSFSGKLFVKDAYQKLAFAWYLKGNQKKADFYKSGIKTHGNRQTDADKQAERFAHSGSWPDKAVLKGRLLSDGGLYQQALKELLSCDLHQLDLTDKLEYSFRMGRIYESLKNEPKALEFYRYTIYLGRERTEHFAARAALQMGLLYENTGRRTEAIKSFRECLSMKNHDFQANIDQQAKAGLNRLAEK